MLHDIKRPMVVAMIAMLIMQPSLDEVVDVVAVRHRLVSAAGAMNVIGLVAFVSVFGCATGRIFVGHFNRVRNAVTALGVVKLAVMEIVDVISMPDSGVTASWAVFVRMLRSRHGIPPICRAVWRERSSLQPAVSHHRKAASEDTTPESDWSSAAVRGSNYSWVVCLLQPGEQGPANPRVVYLSISPNTMSSEPTIAETSANIWPLARRSIAWRLAKEGARILHL